MSKALTKEQIAISKRNNKKAWEAFGYHTSQSHKGLVLHHVDVNMINENIERYLQWNPCDLVVMTRAEHTILHNRLRDYPTGEDAYNYGKLRSTEARHRISLSRIGKEPWNKGLSKDTDERVANYGKALRGRTYSEETIKNMSEAKKGEKNPMYGKKGKDNPNYGKQPWNAGKKFPGRHWKMVDGKRVYY